MKATTCSIISSFIVIATISAAGAADVLSWRKDGNGLYPGAKPPLDWEDKSKLVWETELAERSNACPILVGDKLFITAEPASLICADAESGKLLWTKSNEYGDLIDMTPEARAKMEEAKKQAAALKVKTDPLERDLYRLKRKLRRDKDNEELKAEAKKLEEQIEELEKAAGVGADGMKKPPAHDTNGYSSYTPVSDGKHVWACFGIGVVVCYDLEGNRIWSKRTQTPDHNWGGASSPTLVDGKLVIRFKDYVALDPATGEEQWRVPTEGIVFNAPANFELEGKGYLITSRGELIRAEDGKKLSSSAFKIGAKPWAFMNTPSVIGNRVYFAHGCEGQEGDAYCLEIPSSVAALEKDGLKQLWHEEVNKNRYYSSPLVHDGVVHLISREYLLQALDAESGKKLYEQKLKGFTGTAYPSLTLVGGLLFVGAEDGNAAFLKPGPKFEELARTKADPYRSTPIFVGDICYLRTQEKLRAVRAD